MSVYLSEEDRQNLIYLLNFHKDILIYKELRDLFKKYKYILLKDK